MDRFSMLTKCCVIVLMLLTAAPAAVSEKTESRIFYGNVYGTIIDGGSGKPVADARVYVTDESIATAAKDDPNALLSTAGWITLPDSTAAARSGVSDADGSYLVNGIPINGYAQLYTIVIDAENSAPVIVDTVRIFPGAAMALQIDVKMPGAGTARVISGLETSEAVVTNNYRHKLKTYAHSPPAATADDTFAAAHFEDAYTLTIYATREGLVGGTTANGHVIRERDHFVALPSTRVLCSKGGYEFQVRLEHGGRTETVPVWDIGPWNIHDNYWNGENKRLIYSYLSDGGQSGGLGRGLPQSQAAYQRGFNGGYDEFGRIVKNPAGIDLADGTYWDALQLNDNAWIRVEYLWLEDDDGTTVTCFISRLLN